jgi:signal transduction histidine kinase
MMPTKSSSGEGAEAAALFEGAPVGLAVLAVDGRVAQANAAARSLLELASDAAVGADACAVLGPAGEELRAALQIALRTGAQTERSFATGRPGAPPRYITVIVAPAPAGGEEVRFLVTFIDRTDWQRLFLASAQREKMAAIGFLAAGVAHEFNNIWSAVYGYAELAKQSEQFRRELVDVTLEQAERASEITRSLLSFSDTRPDVRTGVRLERVIQSVAQLVGMELRARSVALEVDVDASLEVLGSEAELQQIFLNLVLNAAHAIGHRGTITLRGRAVGETAEVRVTDTGPGMTPEEAAKVFVPFYTTKGALGGNDQVDGHGLGLTLTYNLVTGHGGSIAVESAPGAGSTFVVRLPRRGEAPPRRKTDLLRRLALDLKGERSFLVIDDEIVLHGLLRAMLAGHQVETVTDAAAARAALAARPFDAVLLDLVLPGETGGREFLDELRAGHPELPVIIITGRQGEEEIEELRPLVASVVQKPFSVQTVHEAVTSALASA